MTPEELALAIEAMGGYTSASRQLGVHLSSLRNYCDDNAVIPRRLIDRLIELKKSGLKKVGYPTPRMHNTGKDLPVKIIVYGGVERRDDLCGVRGAGRQARRRRVDLAASWVL